MKYLLILTIFIGCTRIPMVCEDDIVGEVAMRINKEVHWDRQFCSKECALALISSLPDQLLTCDKAVQIALFNNHSIQARFEEIGIAEADLYQAVLIKNPFFDIAFRLPTQSHLRTDIEGAFLQSIVDLLLKKSRKKIALLELEKVKKEVIDAILDLAFEVEKTFIDLVIEKQKNHHLLLEADATEVKVLIAAEQLKIGNINEYDYLIHQKLFADKSADVSESYLKINELHFKLSRLLGIESSEICFDVLSEIPEIPSINISLCEAEEVALSQRLDYQALVLEIEKITTHRPLKSVWAQTNLAAGVGFERNDDVVSGTVIGPAFAGEIPIFDYGQAGRARLFAEFNEKLHQLHDLKIKILYEVREAYFRSTTLCNTVLKIHADLVAKQKAKKEPLKELYNVMGASIYDLLDEKIQLYEDEKHYLEQLGQCLTSRIDLSMVLGGRI